MYTCKHTHIDIYIYWSDPPTNGGIMDFNCNFPAKIAQQPRDQNHKQFERPNLLNPKFSDVEPKYEITLGAACLEPDQQLELAEILLDKIPFGQRERQQCRDEFDKGQILLRDKFC